MNEITVKLRRASAAWYGSMVLAGLTASFAFWDPLETIEREHVRRTTAQWMESLRADIRYDIQSRLLAQVRLAETWGDPAAATTRELELVSRMFLDHHAGYVGLEWIDSTARVLWAVSHDTEGGRLAGDLAVPSAVPIRLMRATPALKQPGVSPRFRLPDGRAAMRVLVPVGRGDATENFLAAVVDVEAALDSMVDDHKNLGYCVSVREGSAEIYRMAGSTRYEATLAQEGTLELPGATWTIRVWPEPDTLPAAWSSLPKPAMVLGGLGSLLMLAIHFGRSAQDRDRALQRVREDLERKARERVLERRTREALRRMNERLEGETTRIAGLIHDEAGPFLTAAHITLAEIAPGMPEEVRDRLRRVKDNLDEIEGRVRSLSHELHPRVLDDLGLVGAVRFLADSVGRRTGVAVEVDGPPAIRCSDVVARALYRFVQEALTNTAKHARATRAVVALAEAGDEVWCSVRDNGIGFSVDATGARARGLGLVGIRDRLEAVGGSFHVTSERGRGTELGATVPVNGGAEGDQVPGTPDVRQGVAAGMTAE